MGRLTEAIAPIRAGLNLRIKEENWKRAAAIASNLSELELTLQAGKNDIGLGWNLFGARRVRDFPPHR